MILTEENQSIPRKTCLFATSVTTDPMWTGLGLNLSLCGERQVTNHVSHGVFAHGTCQDIYVTYV
jgi:hypothetical protein